MEMPPSLIRRAVVTGVGAVTPIGTDAPSFWAAAREGRSGVRAVEGFDAGDLRVRIAAQVSGFRPEDHLRLKDRAHLPRVVPLALAAAREALAAAGMLREERLAGSPEAAAVILGSGGGGLEFTEKQLGFYYRQQVKQASVYVIPSSTTGIIASEVSTRFGIRGWSHVLSDGCTSSTDAIGHALRAIRHADADVVLTGGADSTITHAILMGFDLMKVLSTAYNGRPAAASRPFDRDRDGFVLGEGAWMLVLEELGHARRRGAPILAEVLGYGATCEAYHRVRLLDDGAEPARAMSLALRDAGLHPEAVDYVALHGTSTRLNDTVETRAVKRALGDHAHRIPMSALKSMIGHPQGASGAAGVVAAVLALRDQHIHPTVNLEHPDEECDLDYVAGKGRPAPLEVALCNCIGFGSKNAALVLRRWHG